MSDEPDLDNTSVGKCFLDQASSSVHKSNAFAGFSAEAFFYGGKMNKPEKPIVSRPQASIAIQVLPKPLAGDNVFGIVDKVISYIKSAGLKSVVGPFETVIEGDFDRLMDIAKECQLICIREGAPSLLTYMKIAYNPNGGTWSIDEKITKHI